jgi:hypothetical protein
MAERYGTTEWNVRVTQDVRPIQGCYSAPVYFCKVHFG